MTESDLVKELQLRATENGGRLFRNNVALGWVGKSTVIRSKQNAMLMPGDVIIRNARPLHAGLFIGSGDLIGWTVRKITPEMVGQSFAVFTSIECKSKTGKARTEQITWDSNVRISGGISAIVKTQDQYLEAIRG